MCCSDHCLWIGLNPVCGNDPIQGFNTFCSLHSFKMSMSQCCLLVCLVCLMQTSVQVVMCCSENFLWKVLNPVCGYDMVQGYNTFCSLRSLNMSMSQCCLFVCLVCLILASIQAFICCSDHCLREDLNPVCGYDPVRGFHTFCSLRSMRNCNDDSGASMYAFIVI